MSCIAYTANALNNVNVQRQTLIFTDERMLAHNAGPGHPERPERLRAILDELGRRRIEGLHCATPRPAGRECIERVHRAAYIDEIEALQGRSAQLDADTAVSPGSIDAAHLAAGAAVDGVEAVVKEQISAFALVRVQLGFSP